MSDQPVAWGLPRPDGTIIDVITPEEHAREPGQYTVPLYTAPPAPEVHKPRKRLTDQEFVRLWGPRSDGPDNHEIVSYGRAIEAAVWGDGK